MSNEPVVETPVKLTSFQEWSALPADEVVSSATEIETAAKTEPASEPETQVADEKEETKLPKGLKKRFSELTSEIRELRTQLAAKPAGDAKPGVATLPEVAKVVDPAKPVSANFDTYEEYVEALTDYKLEQRDALRVAIDAKANQAQVVKTQVEAARARHADYNEVVTDDVEISPAMAEVLVGSEHGAEIAYFLGSNPEEASRIFKLSPARAGAELMKIEASLDLESPATPTKNKTATTKAPIPPKVLTGAGSNTDAQPDPKDFTKWSKWKDREDKRKNADD